MQDFIIFLSLVWSPKLLYFVLVAKQKIIKKIEILLLYLIIKDEYLSQKFNRNLLVFQPQRRCLSGWSKSIHLSARRSVKKISKTSIQGRRKRSRTSKRSFAILIPCERWINSFYGFPAMIVNILLNLYIWCDLVIAYNQWYKYTIPATNGGP